MADEPIQTGGICEGTWLNKPAKMSYLFSGTGGGSMYGVPPYCSGAALGGDMGGYGCLSHEIGDDIKGRLTSSSSLYDDDNRESVCIGNSVCDSRRVINGFPAADDHEVGELDERVNDQHAPDSIDSGELMDASTLQMMGFEFSPTASTSDWNQGRFFSSASSETGEGSHKPILQAEDSNSGLNLIDKKDRNSLPNSSSIIDQRQEDQDKICRPSSLLQSLKKDEAEDDDVHDLHDRLRIRNFNPMSAMNELRFTSDYYSYPSKSYPDHHDQVAACYMNGLLHGRSGPSVSGSTTSILHPTQSSIIDTYQSRSSHNPILASKVMNEADFRKTSNDEQATLKRPRLETSQLPTFKVRKDKLGDRITALQQLVSPFGKTDTASVLHEATEYIKYLHDQVQALGRTYLKDDGAPDQRKHHQQIWSDKQNEEEEVELGRKQDLRSRGLCLVPSSSAFPVASESTVDFWTPFGGEPFS